MLWSLGLVISSYLGNFEEHNLTIWSAILERKQAEDSYNVVGLENFPRFLNFQKVRALWKFPKQSYFNMRKKIILLRILQTIFNTYAI